MFNRKNRKIAELRNKLIEIEECLNIREKIRYRINEIGISYVGIEDTTFFKLDRNYELFFMPISCDNELFKCMIKNKDRYVHVKLKYKINGYYTCENHETLEDILRNYGDEYSDITVFWEIDPCPVDFEYHIKYHDNKLLLKVIDLVLKDDLSIRKKKRG